MHCVKKRFLYIITCIYKAVARGGGGHRCMCTPLFKKIKTISFVEYFDYTPTICIFIIIIFPTGSDIQS